MHGRTARLSRPGPSIRGPRLRDEAQCRRDERQEATRGSREALDEFVVALGRSGIAVRRLELLMSALESMFLALTGAHPEDSPAETRAEAAT